MKQVFLIPDAFAQILDQIDDGHYFSISEIYYVLSAWDEPTPHRKQAVFFTEMVLAENRISYINALEAMKPTDHKLEALIHYESDSVGLFAFPAVGGNVL